MYVLPTLLTQVYAATDPVSFQMSATADAPYARIMRPVQLPRDAAQMPNAVEEPRVSVGKLAQRMMHGFSRADSESGRTSAPSSAQNTPRALPIPVDELESGERRFRALNPNGCIDYVIDVGNLSSVRRGAPTNLTAVFAIPRHARCTHELLDKHHARKLFAA